MGASPSERAAGSTPRAGSTINQVRWINNVVYFALLLVGPSAVSSGVLSIGAFIGLVKV